MSDEEESEIVFIRKRHGEEEEGHHGGVWKLAFADFMTAMMAFFLVMWLINSTSKETKLAIVQYFNPVQLVDSNPAHKGLRDPTEAGQGKSAQHSAPAPQAPTPHATEEKDASSQEAALLYDPMATLDEIVGVASPSHAVGRPASFGDPFDRSSHGLGYVEERLSEESGSPAKGTQSEPSDEPPAKPEPKAKPEASTPAAPSSTPSGSSAETKANSKTTNSKTSSKTQSKEQQKQTPQHQKHSATAAGDEGTKSEAAAMASMRSALEKIVQAEEASLKAAPHFEVSRTSEGMLISLTDELNFSMFAVGSVKPTPQLVRIIGQIGEVLSKQAGDIELRGHTDARSYKSKTYDNWRLSADRANMAYYMLVRGGLPEKRVVKIAGYADRSLKTPKDPLAAVNRRIEILVRKAGR